MPGPWQRDTIINDMTLMEIDDLWGRWYRVEECDRGWFAVRNGGKTVPTADTLAGLESAIRADFWRWTAT